MLICLMIEGQEGVQWEEWLALALAAEAAGLDGLFRSDHYRSFHRGEPAGSLDAWTRRQRSRASSTVGTTVLYSSAKRMAACTERGFAAPPTMIGGLGCWRGLGQTSSASIH